MSEADEIKQKIFRAICKNDVCIMNAGYATPTKPLSEAENISYYMARKYCKELEKEGLIEYIKEYIPAQFDYETGMELQQEAFWNIGWRTTKKALETEIWKQEQEKEDKIINEIWGEIK